MTRPCLPPPAPADDRERPTDPAPEGPVSLRAERADAFLDVLADRALSDDPNVINTILTVGSGARAVDASSDALIERILARAGGAS